MVKIVHCSDTHFDSPFSGLSVKAAEKRREEQFETFEKIIDITEKENADILLLAGDLFENAFVMRKTADFMARCFKKISSVQVFISPGNHDYIDGNSIYSEKNLGDNVTVFGEGISFAELKDKKCRVYGCGFAKQFYQGGFDGFCAESDDFVNIGVFHCALPPYADHNPITRGQIEKSGLDYLAAGHIHIFDGFHKAGKTTYAYSGTPEGKNFDETGEKGIIIGEVSKEGCDLHFMPVCKRQIYKTRLSVSGCLTYADITGKLQNADADGIYSIELFGERGDGVYFDMDTLAQMLSEHVFFAKVTDSTKSKRIHSGGILEEEFLKALSEQGLAPDIYALAAEFGTEALEKGACGK